jgi:hypothetical protein
MFALTGMRTGLTYIALSGLRMIIYRLKGASYVCPYGHADAYPEP